MAYEIITQPLQYMAGYSTIPLNVLDDAVANTESYSYLVNIVYNEKTILNATTASYEGYLFTLVNYSTPHDYKRGDELLLTQQSGYYDGYYTVLAVPTDSSIIIDLELGQGLTGTTTTANHIPYNISPSPTNDIREDLSDTLKNFVTQNLNIENISIDGSNTRFDYSVKLGYEGKALFEFYDNAFISGNTGFYNTGLTATTQVDFQIGDQIIIEQDLYEWPFVDNFFSNGNLGLSGTTSHPFISGDTIIVTGQITEPYYNGNTVVIASASTNTIRTAKGFVTSTPQEGGIVFCNLVPQYNTTAIITNIFYQVGLGVVILTDLGFARSTPPIGGRIRHSDGQKIRRYNVETITGGTIYNSRFDDDEYSMDAMIPYVIKDEPAESNNFSTILNGQHRYRIEPNTKSWLLVHNHEDIVGGALYRYYDENNSLLAEIYQENDSDNNRDYYMSVGIDDMIYYGEYITLSGNLETAYANIDHYEVYSCTSDYTINSNPITFELNRDCSQYEMYHLMWKDKMGSWVSYPFKYVATTSLNVERKNYYTTSGNWSDKGEFSYNSNDRGETTFMTRGRDKITINSGWIEEFENELIRDMFLSSQLYVQTPDNKVFGCILTSDSLTFGSENNVQMWQYQFEIRLANNMIRL